MPRSPSGKSFFFGLLRKRRDPQRGKTVVQVRWGRLLLFGVLFSVLMWLGKSLAFYYFFKDYKQYPDVTFSEMLIFPANLKTYRIKMGNYDIQQCKKAFEQGEYSEARIYAYTGVVRAPANLEGRFYLAMLNRMHGRPDQAMEVLQQGIPYVLAQQPNFSQEAFEFMQVLYEFFSDQREDEALNAIVETVLEAVPGVVPMTQTVAKMGAALAYLQGDFDRAERFIQDYGLKDSSDGILLAAQVAQGRGDSSLAIDFLAQGIRQFAIKEPLFLALITYLRDSSQPAEALKYARLYTLHKPISPGPVIQVLYCLHDLGDEAVLAEKIESFLTQFGDEPEALEKITYFAAETSRRGLVERLYQIALDRGLKKSYYLFLLLEVDIRAGDYAQAAAIIAAQDREALGLLEEEGRIALFRGFEAVVHYALGAEVHGEYALNQLLQTRKLPLKDWLAIAWHCQRIDRPDKAALLFSQAYQLYPQSEEALQGLIETQLDLSVPDQLTERLEQLLVTRRPPPALLQRAYTTLAGDCFLFTEGRMRLLDELERAIKASLYSVDIQ